jgi:hypothetical protein
MFCLDYFLRFHLDKTGIRSTADGCNSRMRSSEIRTIMTRLNQADETIYQFHVQNSFEITPINAKHLPVGRCCLFRT